MAETAQLVIDPEQVDGVFIDCLYKSDELEGVEGAPEGAVIVQGIVHMFGFNPERLENKREQVKTWLAALPHEFRKSGGGGWSFLNACNQANGVQWTGLHQRMEQLFALGIGLELAECQLPRELWPSLPGRMPYYVINVE